MCQHATIIHVTFSMAGAYAGARYINLQDTLQNPVPRDARASRAAMLRKSLFWFEDVVTRKDRTATETSSPRRTLKVGVPWKQQELELPRKGAKHDGVGDSHRRGRRD